MKVVHLTSVHPPFDTRIFHRECKTLSARGYDVSLIVPGTTDRTVDGVRMISLPAPRTRLQRMAVTVTTIARMASKLNADIYHLHDPELLRVAGTLRRRGGRVIYDAHEDYAKAILTRHWIPKPLASFVAQAAGAMELRAARELSGVVAATPFVAERFVGMPVTVVQNFPETGEFTADGDERVPLQQRFDGDGRRIFAYVGNVSAIRGAEQMVDAAGIVARTHAARLQIAGTFSPVELERMLETRPGWQYSDILGWVDRTGLAQLLGIAYAGLVTIQPVPNLINAYPVKMFEYMAAGVPVIASDFPLWRQIVEQSDCGVLVDPTDPGAIAAAMRRLLDDPDEAARLGQNGKLAVETTFNWAGQGDRLVQFYARIMESTKDA